MTPPTALSALLIFAGTYLVLALGRLPGFRVDRTGAAIIGATLMVALNVLTISEAIAAVNTDTIILLFGMMIVVANLRLSRFFALVTQWVSCTRTAPWFCWPRLWRSRERSRPSLSTTPCA
jgi:Na+/H+ antiporter NhaD/arsenite permease-like protein